MKSVRDFDSFQEYAEYKIKHNNELEVSLLSRLKKALSQVFPNFMTMCHKSGVTFSFCTEDYTLFLNFPGSNEIRFGFGVEELEFPCHTESKKSLVLRSIDDNPVSGTSSYEILELEDILLNKAVSFY